MPSWTEKPHAVPTINVNLKPCDCGADSLNAARRAGNPNPVDALPHMITCAAAPVLIHCPIPRSVTFEVALGKCTKLCADPSLRGVTLEGGHLTGCAAKPIRVTCSISGKTWAKSEVDDCEPVIGVIQPDGGVSSGGGDFRDAAQEQATLRACRERWALVKAVVTGQNPDAGEREGLLVTAYYNGMLGTRDQVFAALCEMTRAENAALSALGAVMKATGWKGIHFSDPQHRDDMRPSAFLLTRYVDHLVEQVGMLS